MISLSLLTGMYSVYSLQLTKFLLTNIERKLQIYFVLSVQVSNENMLLRCSCEEEYCKENKIHQAANITKVQYLQSKHSLQ